MPSKDCLRLPRRLKRGMNKLEKCNRVGNLLVFCPEMENEIETDGLFENASPGDDRHLILMNGTTFIDFCPFCGGKVAED